MLLNIKSSINRSAAFSRKFFPSFPVANRKGDSSALVPSGSGLDLDPLKVANDVEDAIENPSEGKFGKLSNGTSATEESALSFPAPSDARNNDADVHDHSSVSGESTERTIVKRKKSKRSKNGSNKEECNGNWSIEQIEAYINTGMKPERDHHPGRRGQSPSPREETTKKVRKVKQVLVTMTTTMGARTQEMVENDSGFGDWNNVDVHGLSIVKDRGVASPGSVLSDCSDKDCSDCVSSLELDGDDELLTAADEISVKDKEIESGLSVIESALGQRFSSTDSSDIETFSEGDVDPLACSVDSIEEGHGCPVDFTCDHVNDLFLASSDDVKEESSDFVVVGRRKKSKSANAELNSHSLQTIEEKREGSSFKFSRTSPSSANSKEIVKTAADATTRIIGNGFVISNKTLKPRESCIKSTDKYLCDVLDEIADERLCDKVNTTNASHCASLLVDYNQHKEDVHFDFHAKDSVTVIDNSSNSKSELEFKFCDDGEVHLTSVDISLDDFSDFNFSSFEPAQSGDEWTVVKPLRRSKSSLTSGTKKILDDQNEPLESITAVDAAESKPTVNKSKFSSKPICVGQQRTLNSKYDDVNIKTTDHSNGSSDASTIRLQDLMRKKPSDLAANRKSLNNECPEKNKSRYVKSHSIEGYRHLSESAYQRDGRPEIPRFCKNGRITKLPNGGRNSNSIGKDSDDTVMRKEKDVKEKCSSFEPSVILPHKEDASSSSDSRNSVDAVDDQNCSTLPANVKSTGGNVIHFENSGFDLLGAQIFLYKAFEEFLVEKSQKPHVVVVFDVNL